MASGSSSESKSGPWKGQQPFLTDVFQQAQGLYRQGVPEYYPGKTYVDFNPIQESSMDRTINRSYGAPHEASVANWMTGTLSGADPNLNPAISAGNVAAENALAGHYGLKWHRDKSKGMKYTRDFIADQTQPWSDAARGSVGNMSYNDVAAGMADGSGGTGTLQELSRGGRNPYLDNMYDSASRKLTEQYTDVVNPALNATFGSAGRTGSRLHAENAADASGDYMDALSSLGADIYGSAYESDANRRLRSAESLSGDDVARKGLSSSLYLGDRGLSQDMIDSGYRNQLNQSRLGFDQWNAGQDRSYQASRDLMSSGLDGASSLIDAYDSVTGNKRGAAGMAPYLSDADWYNIDRMRGVGDDVQGLSKEMLQDDMNRFNYYQQAPYDLLDWYGRMVGGTGAINVTDSDSKAFGLKF